MHSLNNLVREFNLIAAQHFTMSYPAFLRQFGIFVRPIYARP